MAVDSITPCHLACLTILHTVLTVYALTCISALHCATEAWAQTQLAALFCINMRLAPTPAKELVVPQAIQCWLSCSPCWQSSHVCLDRALAIRHWSPCTEIAQSRQPSNEGMQLMVAWKYKCIWQVTEVFQSNGQMCSKLAAMLTILAIVEFLVNDWHAGQPICFRNPGQLPHALQQMQVLSTVTRTRLCTVHELVLEPKLSHEEADKRMLLHATHAAHNGFMSIRLHSPDTDVTGIEIPLASQLPAQVTFCTRNQHCNRYTHPSAIVEKQGEACVSLMGPHCFRVCDSCTACSRTGKTLLQGA